MWMARSEPRHLCLHTLHMSTHSPLAHIPWSANMFLSLCVSNSLHTHTHMHTHAHTHTHTHTHTPLSLCVSNSTTHTRSLTHTHFLSQHCVSLLATQYTHNRACRHICLHAPLLLIPWRVFHASILSVSLSLPHKHTLRHCLSHRVLHSLSENERKHARGNAMGWLRLLGSL